MVCGLGLLIADDAMTAGEEGTEETLASDLDADLVR